MTGYFFVIIVVTVKVMEIRIRDDIISNDSKERTKFDTYKYFNHL